MSKQNLTYLSLLAFCLSTLPIFFDTYRSAAFHTISHDDYAWYLMALVGADGGVVPGSPFAYRILSVVACLPFYYLLPPINFTQLKNVDPSYMYPSYLQATQAICFTSFVAVLLTAVVIYKIARKHYAASPASAMIAALLSFFVGAFLGRYMIDPLGVLMISTLILVIDKPKLFVPLILLSIGINEKIVIVLTCLLAARFIQAYVMKTGFQYYVQLIAAGIAFVSYYLIRQFLFKLPGYEHQLEPGQFMHTILKTLHYTFSSKGFFLSLVPLFILLVLILIAYKYREQNKFQIADISCLLLLFALALVGDVKLSIGRVIMYTFPLYLPAITTFLDDILNIKQNVMQESPAKPINSVHANSKASITASVIPSYK